MTISNRQKRYVSLCREIASLTEQLKTVTPAEAGELAARCDDIQSAARALRLSAPRAAA